jgi:predicted RNase H-like HicB family nuclease
MVGKEAKMITGYQPKGDLLSTPIGDVLFQRSEKWWACSHATVPGAYGQGETRPEAYQNMISALHDMCAVELESFKQKAPVNQTIACAPLDDEPLSDETRAALIEARAEVARGETMSTENLDVPLSPRARAMLEAGLASARRGEIASWQDRNFKQYLDDDDDKEKI